MRLIPSDPDVETIVGRIRKGSLDLQPDFQRGEVWSTSKKQKLIDSILREWHVPPIHVIKGVDGATDVVLDGQQRLTAIRDFLYNDLQINGDSEPSDPRIKKLHGFLYKDLMPEWQNRVNSFPIRQFLIVDYNPSEPSELFYRLNQPVALTAAEQRNSFFGKPREQIKLLVEMMGNAGLDKQFLGFSNARMSYDDVLARLCMALENGLSTKIAANLLADRYRSGAPFSNVAYQGAADAIQLLGDVRKSLTNATRLNKASLFSWLVFFSRCMATPDKRQPDEWAGFFTYFEANRPFFDLGLPDTDLTEKRMADFFAIYNDRVTSRVADVSSVLLRDLTLWGVFITVPKFEGSNFSAGRLLKDFLNKNDGENGRITEKLLTEFLNADGKNWELVQ